MELIHVTFENLNKIKKGKWFIVFWVPWGKPSFDQIDIFKKSKIKENIGLINVEENQEISEKYNVVIYPTTIYMIDGIEKYRFSGVFDGRI